MSSAWWADRLTTCVFWKTHYSPYTRANQTLIRTHRHSCCRRCCFRLPEQQRLNYLPAFLDAQVLPLDLPPLPFPELIFWGFRHVLTKSDWDATVFYFSVHVQPRAAFFHNLLDARLPILLISPECYLTKAFISICRSYPVDDRC